MCYQWRADGSAISGATAATLEPGEAQAGKVIGVAAGYTDAHGTTESVATSATSATITGILVGDVNNSWAIPT